MFPRLVENGHRTTELGLSRRARNRPLVNVTRGRFAFRVYVFYGYPVHIVIILVAPYNEAYITRRVFIIYHIYMEGAEHTEGQSTESAPVQAPMADKKPGNMLPVLGWILSAVAFLIPIFAIPNVAMSLDASKTWLLVTAVFAGGLATLLHLLLRGELTLSKGLLCWSVRGVAVATVLSALFSPHMMTSLMGTGSQVGTLSSTILLVLLAFFAMQALRERTAIFRFILALFGGFTLLAIFHILRLVASANIFSFGVFQSPVFSLVGKWNDFAVFSGLILILAVVAEHYFKKNPLVLWASRAFALIATIFLVMIDFWILWLVIAVIATIFVVRTITFPAGSSSEGTPLKYFSFKSVSYAGIIVLVLGLGFGLIFRAEMFGNLSQKIVGLIAPQPYAEIVLPPSLTIDIAQDTWKEGTRSAILGVGPNRFSNAYFMHKPDGINATPLWDSSFEAGFSHVTTFFTTGGILSMLAWLFLILSTLITVFGVFKTPKEGVRAYLAYSIALGTLYLLSVMVLYLPNISTVALFFLFVGTLAGMNIAEGGKVCRISLPSAKGWGVAMVPLVVLLAIGLSVWAFDITRALRSETAYQYARVLANQGDIRGAFDSVTRATTLGARDSHYRLITDLHLLELQRVLSEAPSSPEALQAKVGDLVTKATASAGEAVKLDPTNYLNYVSRASVGDLFATLNVDRKTTATIARDAYIDASRLNPKSPRLEFAIGRAELLLENREGAKLHLGKARDLRPAYPEAIAALAELNQQDGNIDKAIEIATAGLQSDPSNFIISFQLGVLYYTNKDYDRAIAALENAVAINPYYADAKYFLGVSYARKGNKEAALKQFQEVLTLNPENKEITRVIKNMNEGRDPLADQ